MKPAYKILTAGSSADLATRVNTEIMDGYTPQGGVTTFMGRIHRDDPVDEVIFAQAVIHTDFLPTLDVRETHTNHGGPR